jgi:anti-sigma regulatory factor (Ser/Thr protein kinase)
VNGTTAIRDGVGAPREASAELRFTIPSTPAALAAVVQMVRTTMERMAFDKDWVFRAELCLQEALLNAHYHGNEENAGREIRVACALAPGKIELEVEDQGKGYEYQCPDSLLKGAHHGRGLYLIRHYMSSVALHGNGARIVMCLNKE